MKRTPRGSGELEAVVMECVWGRMGPMTVRDVIEQMAALDGTAVPAYTTVMTVMDRLHKKGWVQRVQQGRAYAYRPTRSREQHVASLIGTALQSSADRGLALAHFAANLPPEELEVLRRALRDDPPDAATD